MNDYEMILENISTLSRDIIKLCADNGLKVSAAESCTGGMISAALTSVAGSSAVIELGICAYSNRIKREVLGVSEETLREHTEYSVRCAEEMARGATRLAGADLGVSTSGIAGPSGATDSDPVGTVYIGYADRDGSFAARYLFKDTPCGSRSVRDYIRALSTEKALGILKLKIENKYR
ncbi:MAG: CinA family protein [Oscillospiraceae bacterium]|nr:CinA family protein [Oscillospiraceae bacterium]